MAPDVRLNTERIEARNPDPFPWVELCPIEAGDGSPLTIAACGLCGAVVVSDPACKPNVEMHEGWHSTLSAMLRALRDGKADNG